MRWLAVLIALLVVLGGCSGGGDASHAKITLGESARFSRAELQAAADAVLVQFRGFGGCTLLELSYDETFSAGQLRADDSWSADTVVFNSTFDTDGWAEGRGLNPNSTYSGWTWTVTWDEADNWVVTNWGEG